MWLLIALCVWLFVDTIRRTMRPTPTPLVWSDFKVRERSRRPRRPDSLICIGRADPVQRDWSRPVDNPALDA